MTVPRAALLCLFLVACGDDADPRPPLEPPWSEMASQGAPSPRIGPVAVWTGTELLVWGGAAGAGQLGDGARYSPASDTWSPMSGAGAPAPRVGASFAWTGTELLIWGGSDRDEEHGDGARYDPAGDTWTPMAGAGAPLPRTLADGAWTGDRFLVWGGATYDPASGLADFNDGGLYEPLADAWTSMPVDGAPPTDGAYQAHFSAGSLWVWGFRTGQADEPRAFRFDVAAGSWRSIDTTGMPTPIGITMATLGDELLVLGAARDAIGTTGLRYHPADDTWQPLASLATVPLGAGYSLTSLGDRALVFGGFGSDDLDSGQALRGAALYDPAGDVWSLLPRPPLPFGRAAHAAVLAGDEVLIVGGQDSNGQETAVGLRLALP